MKKNKIEKSYAIWITGLPGSGKTTIGKHFYKKFKLDFGPTVFINGDDIRNIFNIKKFDLKSRIELGRQYSKFFNFISKQNVNIIFTCVEIFDEVRKLNKKNNKNYIEVFIDAKIKTIIKKKKKKLYLKKRKNMIGLDIKAELPKNPDIKIINNFSKSTKQLSQEIYKRFLKIVS